MLPILLSMVVAVSSGVGAVSTNEEARRLIDTIESLQQPVGDLRCEFEGTERFKGKGTEKLKLGEDGLSESFSGSFIWERSGAFRSDSLHQNVSDGGIMRETLIVRPKENQAEKYSRPNDAPLGSAIIQRPEQVLNWCTSCPRDLFLIDDLKKYVADENGYEASVEDEQIDGRPLKVLTLALRNVKIKGAPKPFIFFRYWIDLRRNGHVVRAELWHTGKKVLDRRDIKLAPFKVGDAEVWVPVSMNDLGYAVADVKNPVSDQPTHYVTMYVVSGSMEFNKHPGREAFTIKYKPGTPISDNLRKLEYEFGQQKIGSKPSKAEAERMLKEQIARAEEQKSQLVVASTSEGFTWSTWLTWGFGVLIVISSVLLWVQRRGH